MRKLKVSEVAEAREQLLVQQGSRCALCQLLVKPKDAVLDHDHSTGVIRATLHRGCNALLGKIENNHKRYGVPNLWAFLHGAVRYMQHHAEPRTRLLHPTHLTPDEKRERRNAKARKRRAATKEKQ